MAGIEDLIGSVMGGQGGVDLGKLTRMAGPLMEMIQNQGGLGNLVSQLQNSPIGAQVNSWIGTGANESVSSEQVEQALGADTVQELAQESGLSEQEVAGGLSALLPNLINRVTPNGSLPGTDQIQGILKGLPGGDSLQSMLGNLPGGLGGLLGGGGQSS